MVNEQLKGRSLFAYVTEITVAAGFPPESDGIDGGECRAVKAGSLKWGITT
jgi:hypothetical protein